jgi:hypothetical protein
MLSRFFRWIKKTWQAEVADYKRIANGGETLDEFMWRQW